jgi:hypothetical protein
MQSIQVVAGFPDMWEGMSSSYRPVVVASPPQEAYKFNYERRCHEGERLILHLHDAALQSIKQLSVESVIARLTRTVMYIA